MSVINSIRSQLSPDPSAWLSVHRRLCACEPLLFWIWPPLGWLGTVATLWCAYFFRDPPRVTPVRDGIVVAPADGRVSQIANAVPPAGTWPWRTAAAAHFDLHECVRLPRQPQPGFAAASSASSIAPANFSAPISTRRARTTSATPFSSSTAGARIGVVQIAGLVARRIVPFAREGEPVAPDSVSA